MKAVIRLVNLIVVSGLHLGFCSMVRIMVVVVFLYCEDGCGDGCFVLVVLVI